MKKMRLILGDQLNYQHSWYSQEDPNVLYVMMEMRQETDYTCHHAQKIIALFASMQNFAAYLRENNHRVLHLRLNDPKNKQTIENNLDWITQQYDIEKLEYQHPDEYRLDALLQEYCHIHALPSESVDSEHFITRRDELFDFFIGKKSYQMDDFYQRLREKHRILMNGNEPEGGHWSYETKKTKPFTKPDATTELALLSRDYSDILTELDRSGVRYMGNPNADKFHWPTSRQDSLRVLDFFLKKILPNFCSVQTDTQNECCIFHSQLSYSLSVKMISPKEVIEAAIREWKKNPAIRIEHIENFVRQILGWREYIRGVYWANMPGYNYHNFFEPLPDYYQTSEASINCMQLQRLMNTGNFILLAGINPDKAYHWYLCIYDEQMCFESQEPNEVVG